MIFSTPKNENDLRYKNRYNRIQQHHTRLQMALPRVNTRLNLRTVVADALRDYLKGPFGVSSLTTFHWSGSVGRDYADSTLLILINTKTPEQTTLHIARNLLSSRGRLASCVAERIKSSGIYYDRLYDASTHAKIKCDNFPLCISHGDHTMYHLISVLLIIIDAEIENIAQFTL